MMNNIPMLLIVVFIFSSMLNLCPGATAIGINYGLIGNNLPPPPQVVALLTQRNIKKVRIFDPNPDVLTALHNFGISVMIGTQNEDLPALATDPIAATNWVHTNVLPHTPLLTVDYITVGNEVYPGNLAQYIPGAMRNLKIALRAVGLEIPVSTVVSTQVLSKSYPPSLGAFKDDANMKEIVSVLTSDNNTGSLLVNVYPYFARAGDPVNVNLNYALLLEGKIVVQDGQFFYYNLFDAMVDVVYTALEKVGGGGVGVTVTETGWPSAGGVDASVNNAQTYVNNLIEHVFSEAGTPKRPGKVIDTYIFALFNENQKAEGVEQHWGLYYPNITTVYPVIFPQKLDFSMSVRK